MQTLKRLAIVAMAVAVSAAPALAGTKYQTNIVPNDPLHPPSNPTLSPKGQIKISDKGSLQVSLAGVTDGGGALVTSSNTLGLDGTEYVAIIKLVIPAISGFIPIVEVPVVVELKNGKGKTKLNVASLFGLIPVGFGRSIEFVCTEVWGPLGGQAAACQAVLTGNPPASLFSPDPACRGGSQIGISGVAIP
jgi:hypothetical protein